MTFAGLALLIAGATGNVTDRILHGGVTDFLEVWIGSYRWPAFNVADSAITVGAALILLDAIFGANVDATVSAKTCLNYSACTILNDGGVAPRCARNSKVQHEW